jgi:hypothetical protein
MTSLTTSERMEGRENFTLRHLAERIKFYVEEDFTYRMTTLSLNTGRGVLNL